jgi:SNF2 family DNA or RNA helicase
MSHGLTLTQANMIIWYAPVTSNDIYTQANGRITRPGQLNKQFIIHIEGTEIERKIFSRLKSKQNMQGILLDSVQQSRPN